MLNFKLSQEIYGANVWMVDPISFSSMIGILSDFRNKVPYQVDGDKLNSQFYLDAKSLEFVSDKGQLKRSESNSDLINVINLDGVITKNGGMSSYGTQYLSEQILLAEKDSRVIGHIIKAASGGGSGNAIQFMTDVMNEEREKPIVSFIPKGEVACSACYGIISQSDYIIAEKENVVVGSLGTMIEFGGYSKNNKDEDGFISVRIYAPDSEHKNESYEEALKGNFKPIIENVLTPANDEFIALNQKGRPGLKKEHLTGKTFKAGTVLGSFVDSIGDFQSAVDKVVQLGKKTVNSQSNKSSTNNKSLKMTKEELKQSHPDVYASIVTEGVNAERERVGAWMAHISTDADAVKAGVLGENELGNAQREEFFVKQNSLNNAKGMIDESANDLKTAESASTVKEVEQKKKEEKEAPENDAFDFELS